MSHEETEPSCPRATRSALFALHGAVVEPRAFFVEAAPRGEKPLTEAGIDLKLVTPRELTELILSVNSSCSFTSALSCSLAYATYRPLVLIAARNKGIASVVALTSINE